MPGWILLCAATANEACRSERRQDGATHPAAPMAERKSGPHGTRARCMSVDPDAVGPVLGLPLVALGASEPVLNSTLVEEGFALSSVL